MRTYSRADWLAAQASWEGFSPEWRELRHAMAMRGVIFAPAGSEFDSWEAGNPSQRAVLIRAIREQPTLLEGCAHGAKSWSDVIERLFRARDDWREEAAEHEAELARLRLEEREVNREAMVRIADIVATIGASGTPLGAIARQLAEQREQDRLERVVAEGRS